MADMDIDSWLNDAIPRHTRLTDSVVAITKNLLEDNSIDFLSVTGKTKNIESVKEKIKRKNYKRPSVDMTDISGVRIILFVESDITKVSSIVSSSFEVDSKNSSNKDRALLSNQVGYRSVHYVCDLGKERAKLPEFRGLDGLKFEFQIRTVLQHAWAELAHDRSYKFRGNLPDELQRSLYLHAGLLEIADKGFSEIAQGIDIYAAELNKSYKDGNLDFPIDSISLTEFIENWSKNHNFPLEDTYVHSELNELIRELHGFEIDTVSQLEELIPENYSEVANRLGIQTNIYGLVRDWMIIRDVDKIMNLGVKWILDDPIADPKTFECFEKLSSPENYKRILSHASDNEDFYNIEDDDLG
ncbi:GTP pyrophosphokinase [Agrobacterium tumefaciens]|uniref:GTP pyrophosphokinase n=1 Tax=Agrobacterium tumefaciens TaxID=358 RepID=UPI001AE16F6C|nr:hypothetical protein [Agrobacterium tumefaciens]MBP2534087.1 ppGpp synthetase/RelA/SpoT-type nucleotidyltransferase [Agrobacterium tumefaciens]